jgi:acetyl esterase/lipase
MRSFYRICCILLASLAIPAAATATAAPVTVHYGTASKQIIYVYPASAPKAPLVVLVHGGEWSRVISLAVEAEELQGQGFAVFDTEYRIDSSTLGAFPMEVADVEAATRYAIAHAAEYNADAANVVELGGSAGGQLVAQATESLNTVPGTVAATIALSGAFYFPSLVQQDREGTLSIYLSKVPQALGCSLPCSTPEQEAWALDWSPSAHVSTATCPGSFLLYASQKELMPLSQVQDETTALQAAGCSETTRIMAGRYHSFQYWPAIKGEVFAYVRSH